MVKAKVWKMGDRWAGISARGKRVVESTKEAARKAVGLSKSRTTKSKTKRKSNPKRRKNPIARRKRRRGRRKFTIPLAVIGGFAPMVVRAAQKAIAGDLEDAGKTLVWDTTGYHIDSGKWDADKFVKNITPLIVGVAIHKFVGGPPLNVNRMLANAGIPFLRL